MGLVIEVAEEIVRRRLLCCMINGTMEQEAFNFNFYVERLWDKINFHPSLSLDIPFCPDIPLGNRLSSVAESCYPPD